MLIGWFAEVGESSMATRTGEVETEGALFTLFQFIPLKGFIRRRRTLPPWLLGAVRLSSQSMHLLPHVQ